jgi:hypothetical protein
MDPNAELEAVLANIGTEVAAFTWPHPAGQDQSKAAIDRIYNDRAFDNVGGWRALSPLKPPHDTIIAIAMTEASTRAQLNKAKRVLRAHGGEEVEDLEQLPGGLSLLSALRIRRAEMMLGGAARGEKEVRERSLFPIAAGYELSRGGQLRPRRRPQG